MQYRYCNKILFSSTLKKIIATDNRLADMTLILSHNIYKGLSYAAWHVTQYLVFHNINFSNKTATK